MYKFSVSWLCALGLLPALVFAQTPDELQSHFKQLFTVLEQAILVPTVIEVPLPSMEEKRTQFLVVDQSTSEIVASVYEKKFVVEPVAIEIMVNGTPRPNINDEEQDTSETFPLPESESGLVEMYIVGEETFTASSIVIDLARNVSLPSSVEVRATVGGEEVIVLAKNRPSGTVIRFPETTATAWYVAFEYIQPLRINELRFIQDDIESQVTDTLRFLAQPGRAYEVYTNPEIYVQFQTNERGNLTSDRDVLVLEETVAFSENPQFRLADSDGDSVPDQIDNCVMLANSDQLDLNQNNRGDVCDDFDRDGIVNSVDNCPNTPNRNQADEDGDKIGDACDEEESRATEKYEWIPWAAMAGAITVFVLLFWIMMRRMRGEIAPKTEDEPVKNPVTDQNR